MSRAPSPPKRRIHWPALLTAFRALMVIPVVVLLVEHQPWIAFVAFAVAALTDGLDGFAARKLSLVSETGQLWDPIADKILVLVSMIGLVVVHRFPAWAAAVIIARELAVTALRLVADRRRRGFPASWAGKFKTGAQLIAVLLSIMPKGAVPHWMVSVSIWIAVALTVWSGLQYLVRARQILHEG
ncbi:MAG: CDP-diacylglycerol--glycerol-3-phosphate 3-phosphatidyltransferase [Actinomycetota bacterium]